MALFFVVAALQVLVLIAVPSFKNPSGPGNDEVKCAEDVEDQPAKEAEAEMHPRARQSCPDVHEGGVVAEESTRGRAADKILLDGSPGNPEVYVCLSGAAPVGGRRLQRRVSRKGSLGSSEDLEAQLGRRASGDKILLCGTPEDSEAYEHHHSQAETSYRGECERPTALMHQNLAEEASPFHDHTGNNPLDQQPDFPPATPGRDEPAPTNGVIGMNAELDPGVSREERHRETEAEEEMNRALKFSYFSTGTAGAGIIGIFSGYLGGQMGHAHTTIHLKVCTFFMLATFIPGASMLLVTLLHLSSHISIKIFRGLKYTTLAFLTLAMFDISILFLKIFAILAFVPTLFIVTIAFFMA